jgi:hypothetical protein
MPTLAELQTPKSFYLTPQYFVRAITFEVILPDTKPFKTLLSFDFGLGRVHNAMTVGSLKLLHRPDEGE